MRIFTSILTLASLVAVAGASEPELPNILWITAEDMSPVLGCYGDDYAITPNLDRLAGQSVRYTNAFATAPVCSPARSCLITGCYPTSLGTHQMRSAFPIPASMRGFPALLRSRGYYTTNNVKTDYNTANWQDIIRDSWDESSDTAHWRKRSDAGKPFFSVFNLMTSHQSRSMVWTQIRFREEVQSRLSQAEIHEPDDAPLPPYYPDTMVNRRVVARFYDCVTAMDKEVGAILRQLDEDGLAEDTIVFFYADHGSGMPRHKRLLLDSGMHVPLLIRFPKTYSHLAPVDAGDTTDRLVSFVDFAPTVLGLADIDVPKAMQGQPFLGPHNRVQREYVFGHRDRVDEAMDLARSVRDKRFLYIRNYMPHLGYNHPSWWPDMGEIRHEFYRIAGQPGLSPEVRHFVGSSRPTEELYDCVADPHNLQNLVSSPEHRETLERMRAALQTQIQTSRDVGFIPESIAWQLFGESSAWDVTRELDALRSGRGPDNAASLYLIPFNSANHVGSTDEAVGIRLLQHARPSVRYWGAISLLNQPSISLDARGRLQDALGDTHAAVRIEAAHALARNGFVEESLPTLMAALGEEDLNVVLHAARTVELLGPVAQAALPAMKAVAARAERLRPSDTPATFVLTPEQDLAMFCSFSANAFLKRLQEGKWFDLYDGDTLDGWSGFLPGEAASEDRQIKLISTGKNLWISHASEFQDFELTVEAKMPPDEYNSGIGFRCRIGENGRPNGYQCEIAESLSGSVFAIGSGGWVWPRGEQQKQAFFENARGAFRTGRWNHFRIRCEGDLIQIWVNGIQTTDIRDDRHSHGRIALQHHGRGGTHRFRNLHIRSLND